MNTHFVAHPVTPNMGLRQAIDAMLSHVAYARHDFGYLPYALHQANNDGLMRDYADVLHNDSGVPVLAGKITDSAMLADLVSTLESLCNDYPAYDDERVSEIENERLISMCEETRADDDPTAEDIARALWETSAYVEQSEYGANVSQDDYAAAVTYARAEYATA